MRNPNAGRPFHAADMSAGKVAAALDDDVLDAEAAHRGRPGLARGR